MNAPLAIPVFVPVKNGKGRRDYQRKVAAKFRAQLCDLMEANGPIGARALAELTGSKVNTVRDYLHEMLLKGVIESEKVKGRNHPTGGTVMCLYRLASEGGDNEPGIAALQKTVYEYPANEVIDPYHLPNAFFGQQKG